MNGKQFAPEHDTYNVTKKKLDYLEHRLKEISKSSDEFNKHQLSQQQFKHQEWAEKKKPKWTAEDQREEDELWDS